MKKLLVAILLVPLLFCLPLGFLLWVSIPRQAALNSPDGKYSVKLSQTSDGWDYYLKVSASRNQQAVLTEELFYKPSVEMYSSRLPDRLWVTNNILWMSKGQPAGLPGADELLIRNNSAKHIQCLRLESPHREELWLLFDLRPGDSQSLLTRPQLLVSPYGSNISAEVWFDSGEKADKYVTFYNPDRKNRTVRYCILVEDDKIRIVSRELDGKSHYPDEDVPHSQSCP